MRFSLDYEVYGTGRKGSSRGRDKVLESDTTGDLTLAELLNFIKGAVITIAYDAVREEQARGFDKNPIVRVDGSNRKKVEDVNPFGSIEFTSRQNALDVLPRIYEDLLKRSPVDTGQYIDAHYVFLNGTEIARNLAGLNTWLSRSPALKENDLIRIVNVQPYARRLERLGVTSQRQQRRTVQSRDKRQRSGTQVLAPNGTYFLTYKKYLRQLRVGIRFAFIPGSLLGLTATFKKNSKASGSRRKKRKTSTYLYPSITILVGEAGKAK